MIAPLSDAWRTVVPAHGDRHGPLSPLLLLLTVVTGFVDAFSYLVLGHVFVANMTGNVVFLGFALAGTKGFSVGASLVALVAFSVGALVSGRLARGRLAAGSADRRGPLLARAGTLQFAFVAGATILAYEAVDPGSGAARYVLIVLLGIAMGVQNGTARRLAVPDLTTTVLTLTLTGMASDGRLAGGSDSRVGRRALSMLAMFLGALVGAVILQRVSQPLCLVLALMVLFPVPLAAWTLSRSQPDWDRA